MLVDTYLEIQANFTCKMAKIPGGGGAIAPPTLLSRTPMEPIGQEFWRDWDLNLIDRGIEDGAHTNCFKTVDGNLLRMEKVVNWFSG